MSFPIPQKVEPLQEMGSAVEPLLWNAVTREVWTALSYGYLMSNMKTYLIGKAFGIVIQLIM